MTKELKQFIADEVTDIASQSSQDRVAKRAKVSSATINHIVNGKWTAIADEMWRKVQVNLNLNADWNTVVTKNFKTLTDLVGGSHRQSMSIGVSYNAGAGKTEVYRAYERKFKNVVYVQCKKTWTTKSYVKALLQAAGIAAEGTVEQMIEKLSDHLIALSKPMVIIDQADKLKDNAFDLFMDLYNDLDGYCGFVVSGVPALEKRVKKGVLNAKCGYAEFWSRIGCKWIKLDPLTLEDTKAICEANGLYNPEQIETIFDLSLGDLRVVKRQVQKYFLIQQATAKKSA